MLQQLWEKGKKLFFTYWKYEFFRFVVIGGINTLMGSILIPWVYAKLFNLQTGSLELVLSYFTWFTFAYLLQVNVVFNSKWEWRRYLLYPLTQIPNLSLNALFLWIFKDLLKWSPILYYPIAGILPIPIMFFLVRYVVKGRLSFKSR